MSRPTGPNVKKLICTRMAQLAVPRGGGIGHAIGFLCSPSRMKASAREATEWAFAAIDAVKTAPDCQSDDDEQIAAAILDAVKQRKGTGREAPRP